MQKTVLIIGLVLLAFTSIKAQEIDDIYPISRGSWLIESNTGFGNILPANTGIFLEISNGKSSWNVGGEVGYFIANRLAIKLGLGLGNYPTGDPALKGLGTILSYKTGAKYYLKDRVPIQIDFTGTNITDNNFEMGFQVGYAFFLGTNKNVSIEPGVRYSIPLLSRWGTIDNQIQLNVGFAIHF